MLKHGNFTQAMATQLMKPAFEILNSHAGNTKLQREVCNLLLTNTIW